MRSTFYAQQAANRRLSLLLMLSVGLMLAALGFSVGFAYTGAIEGGAGFTVLAVVLGVALSLGSYFRGDAIVLAASGATPADPVRDQQLINVVQEMAIAANVPMPKVYVIDDTAPNAFATGRDPEHASVAVTTGLVQKLDREALQGVIAHELGHVRNLDIRFLLLIGVLVGGIALLSDMFMRSLWFGGHGRRSRSEGGGGAQAIMMVVAIALAILAPIAARLVQLSVSRQREYLADATAVELTRNPVGLERALAAIATDHEVLE
ncbi:MAG: M48 family metallopeptidase, partial [Chloroflexi bacterium]|nr:M48 family metallopeptidase [Chloroflexota bacterium]